VRVPDILHRVSQALQKKGARAVIVGGAVRDHFLGVSTKDYDIEVYGLPSVNALEAVLLAYGSVNLVGKSFGILKFKYDGMVYDFSFPRKESKTGMGHKGFDVLLDGNLAFEAAARRRDFTVNALGYDMVSKSFLDPFGGLKDMERKMLIYVDRDTFQEDPLRVYRAVQLSARLGFTLEEKTAAICRQMVVEKTLDALPKERVYEEWKKLLIKAPKPSRGFEQMRILGILPRYFPELHAIVGIPQSPEWHPEGDVWRHTMYALDSMAFMLRKEEMDDRSEAWKLKLLLAVLCHDLGKATHTTLEQVDAEKNGPSQVKIRAIGHEKAGVIPAKSLLSKLMNSSHFIESILPLILHHMKPSQFYATGAKDSAIRKLATQVNIEELVLVAKADFLGRKTEENALGGIYRAGEWLMERATMLQVEKSPLKPLLQGRDLIAMGLTPSPRFKEILERVYAAQLTGKIATKEAAELFVRRGNL
jgi:tRNA nucleotidyltransferase (CCA-adding enzyme)